MNEQYEHDCDHHEAANKRLASMDETSWNGFAMLARGIKATIAVVVEHGNRDLHGGMRGDYQDDDAPGEVRPCCEQGKDGYSQDVKHDWYRVAEQVETQGYVVELALFGDLHEL